jgi:hypothetical protein
MDLLKLDNLLWAASFLGDVVLLGVLILRGRTRNFPLFTSLVGFDVLLNIALYTLNAQGMKTWYSRMYWGSEIVDFALQIGVVVEMARIVLRPTGAWVRDARKQFILWTSVGAAVAVLLAWGVSPPGLNAKEVWQVRGSLFSSLVTCEMVLVMALASTRLGLGWRSHVMALGEGLGAWSIVAVAVDSIQSFLGTAQQFAVLDRVRIFVYCAALAYWIVQFWLPEPVRRPISPELNNYILALHRKVTYDLDRVDVES